MKLTKEQIKKIKELKKTKTAKEISNKLFIPYSTVMYHYSKDYKDKQKERAKKKRVVNTVNQKEYQKNYHRNKYQTDEKYREYIKLKNRENQRRKYNNE